MASLLHSCLCVLVADTRLGIPNNSQVKAETADLYVALLVDTVMGLNVHCINL